MKKLIAALPLLALGACASSYVGTPYAAPATPLTSVGLMSDALPEDAVAMEAASTMGNFGLLGALIDAGVQSSRKSRVNDALDSIGYQPEPRFEQYMKDALASSSVSMVLVDGGIREKRDLLKSYPAAPSDVQALVDVSVQGYGYINAGNKLWRPMILADVRMMDAQTGKKLMENRIAYNAVNAPAGVITIAPNPEYVFQNREDMVTHPERLAEGIDDALRQVAEAAVKLMR